MSDKGSDFFHSAIEGGTRLVVTALDLELSDLLRDNPTLDVVVHADVIRVRGRIELPGRSIELVARTVVGTDGASIDVSGKDAAEHLSALRGTDGQFLGGPGQCGAEGAPGGSAGAIAIRAGKVLGSLTLLANGGRGGRGQDGGIGAPGANGTNGGDEQSGGTGGTGGAAGAGGAGGRGGDSGRVSVATLERIDEGALTISARPGAGGAPGVAGRPGSGGAGGPGGDHYEYHTRADSDAPDGSHSGEFR